MPDARSSAPARSSVNPQHQNIPSKNCMVTLGKAVENPAVHAAGFWLGNLHAKATIETFPPSHEPLPLSKPAGAHQWRFMEKWFSGRGFVAARDARRCSGFVRIAIADNAIAARPVRPKLSANNDAAPTVATSNPMRGAPIIAIGSASIANAGRK